MTETILFSWDHAGVDFIKSLNAVAREMGFESLNLGLFSTEPVDYPDYTVNLVKALLAGQGRYGVLVCGSGIGMCIGANRYKEMRAALCTSEYEARVARAHNDANILCLGSRVIGIEQAKACLKVFLSTTFEGGRHARRVQKLEELGV